MKPKGLVLEGWAPGNHCESTVAWALPLHRRDDLEHEVIMGILGVLQAVETLKLPYFTNAW